MKIQDLALDNEGVYVNHSAEIDYDEGNGNEQYVYQTLRDSKDNSIFSPTLQASVKGWSSEYHFSPYRCNIIRPINVDKNWDVLEIGAGCGSITRYLGETGANITAVEGSYNRAKCVRQRCKGLSNVKVYCSNVENIEFDFKYDLITLIGVFEYTAKYSKKDDPYNEALKFYRSLLKKDGILVIAIENKLGLKYFSGFNEDHTGIPYYGLENRYGQNDVRTFGKHELEGLLINSGFDSTEFLYPFPDYKLPRLILTEKGLENDKFAVDDLIRSTKSRNYSSQPKANLLNEQLIWSSLGKNKLIADLANSFLVIAKNNSNSLHNEVDRDLLGNFFACDRKEPWSTSTTFKEKDGTIDVSKESLISNAENIVKSELIQQDLSEKIDYFVGQNLHHLIIDALNQNDIKRFHVLQKTWIDYLIENALDKVNKDDLGRSILKPEFFDCLPSNLILDANGHLNLIDTEWRINTELNLNFLIIRHLSNFTRIWGFTTGFSKSFKKLVDEVLVNCGLRKISARELKNLTDLDASLVDKIMLPGRIGDLNLKRSLLILLRDKIREIKQYIVEKHVASR